MSQPAIKQFNTAGPCVSAKHYMLPVLPRQSEVHDMINGEYYFVLHAPRQSGKTTFLKALTANINYLGQMYALYCSLEICQGVTEVDLAMTYIAGQINESLKDSDIENLASLALPSDCLPNLMASLKISSELKRLSVNLDKDLIVFFDEADCLTDAPLITFLRQIRLGYNNRFDSPASKFPRSLALVGMRDIRDYLVQARLGLDSKGLASPFNIKKDALTLANFTREDIQTLYHQHTEASGQIFDDLAIDRVWYWSEGQPWLVNALAYEAVVKISKNNYSQTITGDIIDQAAQASILRQDTHLDSLLERLKEPRVRRVIEPVFLGLPRWPKDVMGDDKRYALDLGLLKIENGIYTPANPIYQEVIARALSESYLDGLPPDLANRWMDGKTLNMTGLLKGFQEYWRENSEFLESPIDYNESIALMTLYAYLQRVLNGGAELHREHALQRMRVDLFARYNGVSYPVELKIKGLDKFIDLKMRDSKKQLRSYIDKCGAKEGWLVIFDKDTDKRWEDKISWETIEFEGAIIHIVGC
ncbi:MAG: AAA-like domain-containing protein [Deltaproteobacteria bacterium]|nr:AAA-like domain-containing protein [Deltaproteobacteria bacterium]